jgi:hypothetical protein
MPSLASFFSHVLNAKLRNARWSWGAEQRDTNRIYLRVWEDDLRTVQGRDSVRILGKTVRRGSPGFAERVRHVQALSAGAEGYGVLCTAARPREQGARRIESFDQQLLLRFGGLLEAPDGTYAEIVERVSVENLGKRSPGIPEGITREDVLSAVREIAAGTAGGQFGDSVNWDVVGNGNLYPPKRVLGVAARRAAGRELTPYDFQSGEDSKCHRILAELGFEIVRKGDVEAAQEIAEESIALEIRQRTDIGPTEKQTLIQARRGQGVYRANLERIEKGCRITGVSERRHLRASHIKPWRDCDDFERLDGHNGLLLSPHVDHLFDQGYISFADDGRLLVSKRLDTTVLKRWAIGDASKAGAFNLKQKGYLTWHRKHVFDRSA